MKSRDLHDEWGQKYNGILTFEWEDAPRWFEVYSIGEVSKNERLLAEQSNIHKDQAQETYDITLKGEMERIDPQGAKVLLC